MANLFWSGVQVSVQSALAASVAITAITKATPGVVSHAGADPADGDYVLMTVQGMFQLHSRVFRVANAAAGTFEIEGEDTSDYETFSSGGFQVITLGTTLSSITNVSPSGGEPEFADTTTIHDLIRTQVPTVTSSLSFGMTSRFDPGDTALQALNVASKKLEQRGVRFTFKNGAVIVFNGYVSFPYVPTGQAQGLVESPLTLTVDGQPTVYAS